MSAQIDKILNAYKAHKNLKYCNSEIVFNGNIAKIKIFGNTIALFFPDGGKMFSNCGYGDYQTTKRRLGELGCDYHNTRNIDLDSLCNKLSIFYANY